MSRTKQALDARLALRLPVELLESIERAAEAEHRDPSGYVRRVLAEHFAAKLAAGKAPR